MQSSIHTAASVAAKPRRAPGIRIILALALPLLVLRAQPAPPDLVRRVAAREAETERERRKYTYRQTVVVQEMDKLGMRAGEYREVRDIIFSPERERTEQVLGTPTSTLKRLVLTEEDFRDVRETQPVLFTPDQIWLYRFRLRGGETIEEGDCWVVQVQPRQILEGQRLFEGLFWADKRDFSIVRSQGRAVPEIRRIKSENLFPRFTTFRTLVDGKFWFPAQTLADDVLDFRTGPLRIRLSIQYANYRRFEVRSEVQFGEEAR